MVHLKNAGKPIGEVVAFTARQRLGHPDVPVAVATLIQLAFSAPRQKKLLEVRTLLEELGSDLGALFIQGVI